MRINKNIFAFIFGFPIGLVFASASSHAITMKECSAKYRQAEQAKTLNGLSWNDFRKRECPSEKKEEGGAPAAAEGASAEKADTATDNAKSDSAKSDSAKPDNAKTKPKSNTPPPVPTGPIVFPKAISSAYASETPSKQRQKTCLDQYNANKATQSNGGLKWIQAGGGYYSECNKRLKN